MTPIYIFSKYTYMSLEELKKRALIYWYKKKANAELRERYWANQKHERGVQICKIERAKIEGEIFALENQNVQPNRIDLANFCASLKL